jgi:hypothetical protein
MGKSIARSICRNRTRVGICEGENIVLTLIIVGTMFGLFSFNWASIHNF